MAGHAGGHLTAPPPSSTDAQTDARPHCGHRDLQMDGQMDRHTAPLPPGGARTDLRAPGGTLRPVPPPPG